MNETLGVNDLLSVMAEGGSTGVHSFSLRDVRIH